MIITVPAAPEVGLKDVLAAGTVKVAEASIAPPAGISARTK
jgi:hypothetical protein